jgi:hypothetical protein
MRDGLIWRDEKIVQMRAQHPDAVAGAAEPAIAFPFTIATPEEVVR